MTAFALPLVSAQQKVGVTLAGVDYILYVRWNYISNTWNLDIHTSSDTLLIGAIPLVTGLDLLEQFGYMNIGGRLEVQTDGDTFKVPTFENLGTDSVLYFITDD